MDLVLVAAGIQTHLGSIADLPPKAKAVDRGHRALSVLTRQVVKIDNHTMAGRRQEYVCTICCFIAFGRKLILTAGCSPAAFRGAVTTHEPPAPPPEMIWVSDGAAFM